MMLKTFSATMLSFTLLGGLAGCGGKEYKDERPAVDKLDSRDRGLQSKDVLAASDQLAMDLLQSPKLNHSRDQWTLVVKNMKDETSGRDFRGSYEVFIRRLRTNIARQGGDRIQLVENKDTFNKVRSQELDTERDDFGQGDGRQPGPGRLQPDYALYGTAYDMPNRGTNYYQLEFTITDLKTGAQVWTNAYEVKVARK
jgi:hypothetical protein